MDQLNVSITDRLAGYVRNKVKSGRYNNASEVVREALRRMGDEDARRTAGKAQRGGHPNGPGGRGAGAAETSQESKGDAVEACHSPVVARGALPRACGGLRAKRFGERKFLPGVIDVETMRQVNKKDSAEHDDHHADCSDSQKSAGENGEASSELG